MSTISICAWNRPIYLLKVLDGLGKALHYHAGGVRKLLISVDWQDAGMSEQIYEAIQCSNIMNWIDTDLVFHDKNLGCTGNTRFCLEKSFENDEEWAIHLEDDTYPSIDLFKYFDAVIPILDNYFAACTFHRPCHELVKPNNLLPDRIVSKRMFEGAGGFAITRKRWNRILEMGGMFGVDYIPDFAKKFDCRGEEWKNAVQKSDRLGFDWPFDRYFSEDLPSLYPIVSRVLNIGKSGLHLSPNQWLKTHHNPNWIQDDYYKARLGDAWDTKVILVDDKKYTEDGYE
jgi:hypothetical protein